MIIENEAKENAVVIWNNTHEVGVIISESDTALHLSLTARDPSRLKSVVQTDTEDTNDFLHLQVFDILKGEE